jgi:predicted DNA-binding transcriptional regulator YafY
MTRPPEGREAIVERLARLLLYTNQCRWMPTYRTIARGLDISERTARRYIDTLERVGWPMPTRRDCD